MKKIEITKYVIKLTKDELDALDKALTILQELNDELDDCEDGIEITTDCLEYGDDSIQDIIEGIENYADMVDTAAY